MNRGVEEFILFNFILSQIFLRIKIYGTTFMNNYLLLSTN